MVVRKPKTEANVPSAPAGTVGFGWAINLSKLTRAQNHVRATQAGVVGKEFEAAVKDRYVALGGLLKGEASATGGKLGKEVNMAEDDGSDDAE